MIERPSENASNATPAPNRRNIVLMGYRCTGKTSVGGVLAQALERRFVDTDAMIQETLGSSIEEIVARNGWEGFRGMEHKLIEGFAQTDNLVIATGGGAVMDERNIENLKRNGWVVWLKGSVDALARRMREARDNGLQRPSLTGLDPVDEIGQVLRLREPLYRRAADLEVDTSDLGPEEVAGSILKALPNGLRR
jgi:shikimate kinase